MVIRIVDIDGIAVLKSEPHAPVSGNGDRPIPRQVAPQWMQPKPGKVHVIGPTATVQHCKDVAEPLNMFGRYSSRRSAIVKGLQTPMLERSNHHLSLGRRLSLVN